MSSWNCLSFHEPREKRAFRLTRGSVDYMRKNQKRKVAKNKIPVNSTPSKPRRRRKRSPSMAKSSHQGLQQRVVQQNGHKNGQSNHCPKCEGLVVCQPLNASNLMDIRCINCGWQPQWGTRIVTESAEVRSIRELTNQFFFQPNLSTRSAFYNGTAKQS